MQSNGVRALVTAAEIKPGGLKRQKFNAQKLQKYRSIEMHRNAMYSNTANVQNIYQVFVQSWFAAQFCFVCKIAFIVKFCPIQ